MKATITILFSNLYHVDSGYSHYVGISNTSKYSDGTNFFIMLMCFVQIIIIIETAVILYLIGT